MAYIPRSSFVPKEVGSAIPIQIKKKHSIRLFSFIATIMLFTATLAGVGLYFYKGLLDEELSRAREGLNTLSNDEDQKKIEEIRLYDKKLTLARELLDNHSAPSRLFEKIEALTKETVQFEELTYTYDPGFDAILTLKGITGNFASVALQKMEIDETSPFLDFEIRDIADTKSIEKGEKTETTATAEEVHFSLTGILKENVLKYRGVGDSSGTNLPSAIPTPVIELPTTSLDGAGATTSSTSPQTS